MLFVHFQRHFVDRRHVDRLHHGVGVDVAEQRHLALERRRQRMLGAQHEDVGLETVLQQGLHRVLRGFGLQLARSGHVGDQRQVNQRRIPVTQRIAQLAHRLDERLRLDVAHRAADLGDDHVVFLGLRQQLNAAFDLVGDVGNDLHGLAQVLALALLLDDALVDTARRDVVGLRRGLVREALVVPQVEVRLGAVLGDVALAVLVGVERSGIYVDVGVEFLNGHRVTAGLQQAGDRSRNNTLAERRRHAARYEYVLGFGKFHYCFIYKFVVTPFSAFFRKPPPRRGSGRVKPVYTAFRRGPASGAAGRSDRQALLFSSWSCLSISFTFSIVEAISSRARSIFARTSATNASAFFDLAKKPMLFSRRPISCSS